MSNLLRSKYSAMSYPMKIVSLLLSCRISIINMWKKTIYKFNFISEELVRILILLYWRSLGNIAYQYLNQLITYFPFDLIYAYIYSLNQNYFVLFIDKSIIQKI